MSEERLIATLVEITAAFNRHDLDGIMAYFAENAVFESQRGPDRWGRRFHGKAAIRNAFATRFAEIPDVRISDETHFAVGDRGVSTITMSGTTVSGERLDVHGCDLWTFRDGRVAKKDSYWKIRTSA